MNFIFLEHLNFTVETHRVDRRGRSIFFGANAYAASNPIQIEWSFGIAPLKWARPGPHS